MSVKFVSVILPLALPESYIYEVPTELSDKIIKGIRVEVALKNKLYSAIVYETFESLTLKYKTRPIISILDDEPIVTHTQMKMWEWMAKYYCCTMGEVMNIALPAGLKLESTTKVIFYGDLSDMDAKDLSDDEYLVAEAVAIQNELTIIQIQEILNKKTIFPVLRSLMDKGIILIREELIEKFKPKTVRYLTLNEEYRGSSEAMTQAFDLVARSENQTKLLLAFVQLSRNQIFSLPLLEVCQLAGVDSSIAKAVIKKEIFSEEKRVVSRLDSGIDDEISGDSPMSSLQEKTLSEVESSFQSNKPALLYGVTGSGKTRIYTELIQKEMDAGHQVLYLLPEIALTTHIVSRLKTVFGDKVLVYHSRMNNQERIEIWKAVMKGESLVIGARSALFLPFTQLGLIVVDEEHDPSFKQYDPSPRYNARDSSIMLSHLTGAQVVLGSATPSMESYLNAINGKYTLVSLTERYGNAILPEIELADLRDEVKDKAFKGTFSRKLLEGITAALEAKEQVILFRNRRGYSPVLVCQTCDWKAECPNCDVKLTKHKLFHELRCHYCGIKTKIPTKCPACGSSELVERGFGTEKIEEELKEYFPDAKIKRLDYDTARTKSSFESIIHDFEFKRIDILVGTQMVTKGLDFDNISLVGVLSADNLLRYPDLRAGERTFQLLTQVSGRAGRRQKQGKVIIQTYEPNHPVIIETLSHSYDQFFNRESQERKLFKYPPYYRMIQLQFFHKNPEIVSHTATVYTDNIRKILGDRVVGPAVPSIARVRNQYIYTVYVKIEKDVAIVQKVKNILIAERDRLKTIKACKSVRINIDVDPY